jgi:predicted AAA+ superfamily ATPase
MHNCKGMARQQGTYIPRAVETVLREAVREFPAVVLTGPRQSGKTTLLRHAFGTTFKYVSMELPDVRAAATADPRGFMATYAAPVIFDEVQYAPDLLLYVKEEIDSHRKQPGQYILTGSQNLLLTQSISETLAGRAAILKLLPLSRREILREPSRPLPWESPRRKPGHAGAGVWEDLLRGGYPELTVNPARNIPLWYASYVQTYLERDIRGLRHVGDITQFQSFLRILAARSGQLINLTDISRDIGVAVNTIKSWLSILEATYQVLVLRPYFANVGKRLVKTPKVYFTDTGVLCYLAGLRDPAHAASGPMAGAIFETAVISEFLKVFLGRGEEPRLFFWRTSTGVEVDLVVEVEAKLIPIEIKTTSTPRPAMAAGIQAFRRELPRKTVPGYVVHAGDVSLPLAPDVRALPFGEL